MEDIGNFPNNYSGNLLVSHPQMLDPNFKRTVVLLSAHSKEDGALGVVLNRPTQKWMPEWCCFGPRNGPPKGPDLRENALFS